MKTCRDCNGDGVVEKGTDDEQQCPTCGGSGFVPDDNDGQEEVIHTKAAELSTAASGETPSDVVAAILTAPPLASASLNPVKLMKFVHGVQQFAETALRHDSFDHMRQIPLDRSSTDTAFVAAH